MLIGLTLVLAACAPGGTPATPAPTARSAAGLAPTARIAATLTPIPAVIVTPTPAPAGEAPPAPRQLTTGGCCPGPFWSADGSQVRFVDRPAENAPAGVWGIGMEGGEPQFIAGRPGVFSADRNLVAYPDGGRTYVEKASGERWVVPADGRAVVFSPDGSEIAWPKASRGTGFDRRVVEVWVARVDGGQARAVARLTGGWLAGWFPDSARLLVGGRDDAKDDNFLAALNVPDGSLSVLARGAPMRGAALSPEGGWVVYTVTFSGDPARDGLWVMRTDGSGARRLEAFGAYRWRSEGRLAVIPLEAGARSQRLLDVEADTGRARALTDPALTSLRIAGGDWSLSPDGKRMAFVSADDHNIWVMDLPQDE